MKALRHQFRKANKYHVSPKADRTVDGITFDSKKEAKRYKDLCFLKQVGDVLTFIPQVPFRLPGGVRYVVDFLVFWADGRVTFEDVKGYRTPEYKAKKRMVEDLYAPIVIEER